MSVYNHQCFREHLCPSHQGCDVTVYPDHPIYTPAQSPCLNLSTSQWGASERSHVLALFGLASGHLGWCISILLEHISHWVRGPTESEATGLFKVSGVKRDLNNLFYHTIHISCWITHDGGAAKSDGMFCFKSQLHHSKFLWLASVYVSRVLYIWFWLFC